MIFVCTCFSWENWHLLIVAITTTTPGQQLFGFLVSGSFVPPRWKPHLWHLAGLQCVKCVLLHREHSPNLRFVFVEGIIAMLQRNQALPKNEPNNKEKRNDSKRSNIKTNMYGKKNKLKLRRSLHLLSGYNNGPRTTAFWLFSCWFLRSTKMEATKPM